MKAYSIATTPVALGDLIHSEYDPTFTSFKRVLLAGSGSARQIPFACPVAEVELGNATVTPGAAVSASGGTPGNGSIGSPTADSGAQAGVYQVVIIEPAANGGVFEVSRPDGSVDGTGAIGTAYNGMINFTLADGATDFVAGDRIPVTVAYAAGSGKVVQWDPTAVNGAQNLTGLCLNVEGAYAEDGVDGEIVVLEQGPVIIRPETIAWPAGVNSGQKTAALAVLAAKGIKAGETG